MRIGVLGSRRLVRELLAVHSEAGEFGLIVGRKYGGQGTPFRSFAKFLAQMTTVDAAAKAGFGECLDPSRFRGPVTESGAIPSREIRALRHQSHAR